MDKYYGIVADREIGSNVPISISTAMALESVFGLSEDHPEFQIKPPVLHNDQIWINVRTLIRNIVSSIASADHAKLFPDPMYDCVTTEIMVINAAVGAASHGRCKAVFYYQTYKSLPSKYSNCFLRTPKTEKQIFLANLEAVVLEKLSKEQPEVKISDLELSGEMVNALIITHIPQDLLSRYKFLKLVLLESHTGKLKTYVHWVSKLTGGKELPRIPFNHVTLQFFGDGVQFQTFPTKEKKQFIEMSNYYMWTPTTTLSRMKQCINGWEFHPHFKAILLSMF